jgi:hypothetical protein
VPPPLIAKDVTDNKEIKRITSDKVEKSLFLKISQ